MGFQAQVDLGSIWLKKMNGSKVKIYCFAMVLAHSRYKFLWWSDKPFTTFSFIDAHIKAFEYFGGIPIEIVYDQDRILAVSENSGDIIYTEGFQNYLNSVRFKIRLCRAYDPESKGKIEAVVKIDCLFRDVWNIPIMVKVIKERFKGKYPVRKIIQTEFAHHGGQEGLQFQLDAIAFKG